MIQSKVPNISMSPSKGKFGKDVIHRYHITIIRNQWFDNLSLVSKTQNKVKISNRKINRLQKYWHK